MVSLRKFQVMAYRNAYPFSFIDLGLLFDEQHPQKTINDAMNSISKKYANVHNILLIDEVVSVNELSTSKSLCIWSNINTTNVNLDFLVALNPQGIKFKSKFRIIPPTSKNTLSQQLIYKHRNSYECDLVVEHFKCLPNTSYLDTTYDLKTERSDLPTGRTPLWLEQITEVDIKTIFACIREEHIQKNETVTLIYDQYELNDERREAVEQNCVQNGWKFQHYSHFFGCEDQVIILFECSLLLELVSRGRNQMIFVTNKT